MRPVTADLLERAERDLHHAEIILGAGVLPTAGREAYLAMFRAAQAVIFELTGKTPKIHSGVRSPMADVERSNPGLGAGLAARLARAYGLKQEADYKTKPAIAEEKSRTTIAEAHQFVTACRRFLETISGA